MTAGGGGTPFYKELLTEELMSGSGTEDTSTVLLPLPAIIGIGTVGGLLLSCCIIISCVICICCVVMKYHRKRRNVSMIENLPKFRVLDAPNPNFKEESGEHVPLTESTHHTRSSATTFSSDYSYAHPNDLRIIPGMLRVSSTGEDTEEYVYAKSVEGQSNNKRSQTMPTSTQQRIPSPYSIPLEIAGKYGSVATSPPSSPPPSLSPPSLPAPALSTVSSPKRLMAESSPPAYESHYMTPATDKESLYAQIRSLLVQQIHRNDIVTIETIGTGNFGLVWKGLWNIEPDPEPVAIKTLKTGSSKTMDIIKFLQEAAIMGQFHHPNVVKLHGVVTIGEPIMIILELMELGDLRQYLINNKQQYTDGVVQPGQLLNFCRQVASGMDYLSMKCFVHRDLAARNIFVRQDLSCKIGDFGLARDLMDEEYYVSSGGKIPIKWTAPEALTFRKYSSSSDVWSFGVLMFEIWSLGLKPFHRRTNQETLRLIEDGYRLPPPSGCPRSIYEIMITCWNPQPSSRPSFEALCSLLNGDEMSLLYWSPQDKAIHPDITILGSDDPSISNELYLDLQMVYKL